MRFPLSLDELRASGRVGLAAAALLAAATVAAFTGFLDPMSLIITLGGSFGVVWCTFPKSRLASTWILVREALATTAGPEELILAVKRLARVHRADGPRGLERAADSESDDFLRRAVLLSFECADETELRDVLNAEAKGRIAEGEAARHVVLTLGKLFPAFGLIGTLIGLGVLLRNLGEADIASMGPGLAIAVLTTLYGAVLANVVVLPVATKLQAHLANQALRTQMTIDGVVFVLRKEYPTRIERALRAYVSASGPTTVQSPVRAVSHRAA
jgi:chemotaxis protein MotA